MIINKKVLHVDDHVTVVDVFRTQLDYASDLVSYIGKSGIIVSISSYGNCEIKFDGTGHHWWFAPSFLKQVVDKDNFIDANKITPKRKVFIGKSLRRLDIHDYLSVIYSDLDIPYSNIPIDSVYHSLHGKFGTIMDKDYIHKIEHGYEHGTKYDVYIGVEDLVLDQKK